MFIHIEILPLEKSTQQNSVKWQCDCNPHTRRSETHTHYPHIFKNTHFTLPQILTNVHTPTHLEHALLKYHTHLLNATNFHLSKHTHIKAGIKAYCAILVTSVNICVSVKSR